MKRLILSALVGVALTASAVEAEGRWQLVFQDNFDKGQLDPATWVLTPRGVHDWNNYMSEDPRLFVWTDSSLILRGIPNDNPADTAAFITGGFWSKDVKAFAPGRYEVRARFKSAKGAWPAIWLLPFYPQTEWPYSGEVDIMEHLNHDNYVWQTVHSNWTQGLKHDNITHTVTAEIDPEGWNTYAVEITPDGVRYFVNDRMTHFYMRQEGDDAVKGGQYPFYCPQYLIIDMQLGGSWVGAVDAAELPAEMEIDWVKVYEEAPKAEK